jgi:hypothetical protein
VYRGVPDRWRRTVRRSGSASHEVVGDVDGSANPTIATCSDSKLGQQVTVMSTNRSSLRLDFGGPEATVDLVLAGSLVAALVPVAVLARVPRSDTRVAVSCTSRRVRDCGFGGRLVAVAGWFRWPTAPKLTAQPGPPHAPPPPPNRSSGPCCLTSSFAPDRFGASGRG